MIVQNTQDTDLFGGPKKITASYVISHEIKAMIEALAKIAGCSASSIASNALQRYIDNALDDGEKGKFAAAQAKADKAKSDAIRAEREANEARKEVFKTVVKHKWEHPWVQRKCFEEEES